MGLVGLVALVGFVGFMCLVYEPEECASKLDWAGWSDVPTLGILGIFWFCKRGSKTISK